MAPAALQPQGLVHWALPGAVSNALAPHWEYRPERLLSARTTRTVLASPSPTIWAATTIAFDMHVGACMANETLFNSGMFLTSQSALIELIPSLGLSVGMYVLAKSSGMGLVAHGSPVQSGTTTRPSIASGDIPASSRALLTAIMVFAPTLVSGFSSQRRAVGEHPNPATATFPLCSHIPRFSLSL